MIKLIERRYYPKWHIGLDRNRNEYKDALTSVPLMSASAQRIHAMTTPRDDLVALAPCPFCGGEAERIDIPTVGSDPDLGGDPNAGGSCISCKQCAASTALHFDRKENLYGSWNDRIAASRPATQVVDREAVARALCESGKFETGEGTCSLLCMDQLGSVRKKGCNHLTRVHGKLVDSILSLLRPAEPVEAEIKDQKEPS